MGWVCGKGDGDERGEGIREGSGADADAADGTGRHFNQKKWMAKRTWIGKHHHTKGVKQHNTKVKCAC